MSLRSQLLLALLVAAAIGVGVAWFLKTHERVTEEVAAPLTGPARYNGFYALERALATHGAKVESRATLGNVATLGAHDLVVLGTDVRTLSAQQAGALLTWVAGGGRLVFALPLGGEGRVGPLLEKLGLTVHEHFDCLRWPGEAGKESATWCSRVRFALAKGQARRFAWLWGNKEDGWVFGRRALGDGDWTAAAEIDFLQNDELRMGGFGEFAWQVLSPLPEGGRVHLVYSAEVPRWYVLFARYSWPILLPVSLALVAWLFARGERLGPVLPLPAPGRRALFEHVGAAGAFAWRRGRAVALHAALLRRVLGRARRRRPELGALEPDALARALAEDAGVTPEAARHALAPLGVGQPVEFLAAIRTLMEIEARHDR